ncbi:MAG: hypothetical protein JEY96_16760 [Bacteroidales bacterium]|nr:hypothetical protein [Bacteroidales bacterium]
MKKLKIVGIILGILMVTIFIINMLLLNKKGVKEFLNYNYSGKVEKIRYTTQGFANIKIDENWYYLGHNVEIAKYINIGDSICKRRGEKKIIVYKKVNNTYKVKKEF